MAGVNDIFGYKRNPKPDGVFSTEDSVLTFGGSPSIGALVQQWQMNYQQQVMELFEIGSNNLYWAKGRPVGNGTVGRIIGTVDAEGAGGKFFPDDCYDICKGGAEVDITARSGTCENFKAKTITIKMHGVVVTAIGFAMRVQDVMLNENIGWRFGALELQSG